MIWLFIPSPNVGRQVRQMQKLKRHILRSDEVKLEGRIQLDVVQPEPGHKGPTPASPQVCIVENHTEFAVLEMTCSCGAKTYVRCEYAGSDSSSAEPDATQQ